MPIPHSSIPRPAGRRFLWVLLFLSLPFISQAQGIFKKSKDGSIKGALEFLPNGHLADGFQRAVSQFPEHKDPMVDPYKWIEADGIRMRGLVKDAVLYMQWWTLLGDPAEKYGFKWITSGQYEIEYEEKGQRVTKYITRSQLTKYPDLLKKFDRIEPYNVNVEITFNSGDIDDQKYYDFRKKYNVLTDLGSAGFKSGPFTIVSNGVHYLFAPSNQDPPFVIPTMAVGGWKDFLNLPKDMSDSKVKSTVELFRLGQELKIHSFRITDLQWPLGTLAEIARQYERYEKKEDTPKEQAEKGTMEKESDGGDDFWNEPQVLDTEMEVYQDPTNRKYGLKSKRGLRAFPAKYNSLQPSDKKNIFFGLEDNAIVAVNSMSVEVARMEGRFTIGKNGTVFGESTDLEREPCCYRVSTYKAYRFTGNQFQFDANCVASSTLDCMNWSGNSIDKDDKVFTKSRWKSECWEPSRQALKTYESQGYISISKYLESR